MAGAEFCMREEVESRGTSPGMDEGSANCEGEKSPRRQSSSIRLAGIAD